MFKIIPVLAMGLYVASCGDNLSRFVEPQLEATRNQQVDLDRPTACHGRDDTPAVIETVTEQVAVPEERDAEGRVIAAARYQTETRQRIVSDRQEIWFETPCRDEWTPEFIGSVQRALIARGLLQGPPSGEIDTATRAAIRAFQSDLGINSDVLSVAAGKRLGLIVYDRAEALAR
nr:peptidoglycan-binding domain-containing protein [Palleronia pontilimi]